MTSDFDNSLCGDFIYEATYDGVSIHDTSLPPVSYDYNNRLFSVYSEDLNLIGLKTITVNGHYALHSSNTYQISFQI